MIYLDNAATTKPIADIADMADAYGKDGWYNPSALYKPSAHVSAHLDEVRQTVLGAVNGYNRDVVFTSSGTESNNMAIFNAFSLKQTNHFVFSGYEHAAVYQTAKALQQQGQMVTFVNPDENGVVQAASVVDKIKDNTVLVSVMHVNNETGALNDIDEIARQVKAYKQNVFFHSDGVQAFLKVPYTLGAAVDGYSISGHKVGALKGTGALILPNGTKFKPRTYGGGQEKGMRPGTENTFGIAALQKAVQAFEDDDTHILALRKRLIKGFSQMDQVMLNSPTVDGCYSPYIVNASVLGVKAQTLLHALEEKDIYIGIGSACSSKTRTNRIHDALGLKADRGESAIRISFGAANKMEEIDKLLATIDAEARILRMFTRR